MTTMISQLAVRRYDQRVHEGYVIEFCELTIDGVSRFPQAKIIEGRQHEVVLHECPQCGHCGSPCQMRSYGNTILWILDPNYYEPDGTLLFQFEKDQYRAAIGIDFDDPPAASKADLAPVVSRLKFPDWRLGLFREPGSSSDPSGHVALRRAGEFLAGKSGEIEPAAPPTAARRIEIALDTVPLTWQPIEFAVEGDALYCRCPLKSQGCFWLKAQISDAETLAHWKSWLSDDESDAVA